MKYLKTFESIKFKKYIIATMPNWKGDLYVFKTLKVEDNNYFYSHFYYIRDDEFVTDDGGSFYPIDNYFEILYQTDDLDLVKKKLVELKSIYKDTKKYNL